MELTFETKLFLSLLYFDAVLINNSNNSCYNEGFIISFYSGGYVDNYKEQKERIKNKIIKIMEENPELIDFGPLINENYVKCNSNNFCYGYGETLQLFLKKHEKIIDWNKLTLTVEKPNIIKKIDNSKLDMLDMFLNNVIKNIKNDRKEKRELKKENGLLQEQINVITDELLELKKQVNLLVQSKNEIKEDLINFTIEEIVQRK